MSAAGLHNRPAILSGNSNAEEIANVIAGVGGAVFFCLLCVFFIYVLALSFIYPAVMVLYAREGTFAYCFKFREIFNLIGKNSSPYLTAWPVNIGISFAVSLVVGLVQIVLGLIPYVGWVAAAVLTVGVIIYTSISASLAGWYLDRLSHWCTHRQKIYRRKSSR